jgi:hypothetical protein
VIVNIKGVDELAAVVPHLLGFQPTESLVVVPLRPGPPVARVDLPDTGRERDLVTEQLLAAYRRRAQPDSQLAVMCFSKDLQAAELASQHLTDGLTTHGIEVPARIWVADDAWTDLNTGRGGPRTREAQGMVTAEFVVAGRQAPAAGRHELVARLIGDRDPISAELAGVRDQAARNGGAAERAWVAHRIDRFDVDGAALSDRDAARLLVAVEDLTTRDDALMRLSTDTAHSSRALWTDLTRRAPDEVRTPGATLLAFSSWLGGDGANAWVALDQIPPDDQGYPLAGLVSQALEQAVPPSAWNTSARPTTEVDNSPRLEDGAEQLGPLRLPDPPGLGPEQLGPRPPAP